MLQGTRVWTQFTQSLQEGLGRSDTGKRALRERARKPGPQGPCSMGAGRRPLASEGLREGKRGGQGSVASTNHAGGSRRSQSTRVRSRSWPVGQRAARPRISRSSSRAPRSSAAGRLLGSTEPPSALPLPRGPWALSEPSPGWVRVGAGACGFGRLTLAATELARGRSGRQGPSGAHHARGQMLITHAAPGRALQAASPFPWPLRAETHRPHLDCRATPSASSAGAGLLGDGGECGDRAREVDRAIAGTSQPGRRRPEDWGHPRLSQRVASS